MGHQSGAFAVGTEFLAEGMLSRAHHQKRARFLNRNAVPLSWSHLCRELTMNKSQWPHTQVSPFVLHLLQMSGCFHVGGTLIVWQDYFYQLRLEASWWVWTWRACCTWPSLRGVVVLARCHGWSVRKAESSCSRSLEFDARFLLGWDHETSWDPQVATVCISQEQRFLPRIWDAMASLNITGKVRCTKCFVGVEVEGS